MTDLIARIEKAQPSEARVVFWEAFRSAFPAPDGFIHDRKWADLYGSFIIYLNAEAYLDAAAMFVPEGWTNSRITYRNERYERVLYWGDHRVEATATTPAFALLAAAIKARQTDEQ